MLCVSPTLKEGGFVDSFSFMQEKLLPTVTTGWKLWIPAHAINFGFVPPSQRVLYVNVIAVTNSTLESRDRLMEFMAC